jgi:HEAT repeat protein
VRVPLTDDLELRKAIAAQAQTESLATAATPAVRAFQFFLVPLLIVGACVLVYALLNFFVANPRSPSDWLEDIEHGGPNTRPHATLQLVQAIRRMEKPDTRLTPKIVELFRRSSSQEVGGPSHNQINSRALLATCLGSLRDPGASEALLEVLRTDPNVQTRAACLEALGAIKDPGTLPELVKLLDDADSDIRKYAALNVGAVAEKAGDRGVIEPLKKLLADPRPDVGWNAALALGYFLGDPSGNDTLRKMLDRKYLSEKIRPEDPQAETLLSQVIVNACNAVARLKDPSFLPLLKRLTDDKIEPNSEVRFIAHKAIAMVEGK